MIMKKIVSVIIILSALIGQISSAGLQIDLGFQMGGFAPLTDTVVKQTFGKNLYWQAVGGVLDINSGVELRGNLGGYQDYSHNPLDAGTDLKLGITNISGSLIWHLTGQDSFIRPYLGVGVGAYKYDVVDNIYGTLETSTGSRLILLAG